MIRRSRFDRCTRALMPTLFALFACTHVYGANKQESWDAIYLGGSKIGYVHTYVEKVHYKGKEYQRVRIHIEQRLKRDKDISVVNLEYGTIETLDGEVLRLDTRILAGDAKDIRAHGDVIGGKMNLILESGERQELVIPWSREVRGPYAPEQSMARKPMNEHERRDLKMFIAELNKVCDITLTSGGIEPVVLGDGSSRPLLRVELTTRVDGKPRPEFDSTMWVDSSGQALKGEQDIFGGIVMYRTTKEAAMSAGGPIQFDLIKSTVIKIGRVLPDPEQTRQVKYRISLKSGDPKEAIPTDSRQTVQLEGKANEAILEVKTAGPLDGQPGPAEVDSQYLKPNVLITSADSRVLSLANQATKGAVDPWEKARRINHWVFEHIRDKNFGVAFAAANEVARNLSGDCTEHAVLAAAMCRAVGIPARAVVGLVYVERLKGFGYHMWYEIYTNQRWVALDPTFDQSSVDAVHIKIAESSLEGVAPFEVFTPILRVAGKLEIEPLERR
ncbi:MAG TPA: transglutaminase-like domain-containing protein [Isosphaeraceae bacterium]|nr:transglutaminase-like domain-containing protein [Isosphaeraceae bacterium]